MPKMTLNRFRVDFIIADSGSQIRVPIDQSLAAVDPLRIVSTASVAWSSRTRFDAKQLCAFIRTEL